MLVSIFNAPEVKGQLLQVTSEFIIIFTTAGFVRTLNINNLSFKHTYYNHVPVTNCQQLKKISNPWNQRKQHLAEKTDIRFPLIKFVSSATKMATKHQLSTKNIPTNSTPLGVVYSAIKTTVKKSFSQLNSNKRAIQEKKSQDQQRKRANMTDHQQKSQQKSSLKSGTTKSNKSSQNNEVRDTSSTGHSSNKIVEIISKVSESNKSIESEKQLLNILKEDKLKTTTKITSDVQNPNETEDLDESPQVGGSVAEYTYGYEAVFTKTERLLNSMPIKRFKIFCDKYLPFTDTSVYVNELVRENLGHKSAGDFGLIQRHIITKYIAVTS